MASQPPSRPTRPDRVSPRADSPDEVHRINHVLRTLRAGHRALLRASDENGLLQEMCRVIVEEGGYLMTWIGYAEHDEGKALRPVAHAGRVDGFFEAARFSWADSNGGGGASGTAVRTGKPSVGRRLKSDPSLAPWREEAIKRGYGAASAFPLISGDDVIGSLAIIAADENAFDEAEIKLLEELADDLAYGIAHLRMQAKHQEAERTIERMAFYDRLTGLPNRTQFSKRLAEAMLTAREKHYPLAVLSIGIGHFNEISDTLGHHLGDRFLLEVVQRISGTALRQDEILGRVGDEEFALLLPRAGADRASSVAQRIITVLYEPVDMADLLLDARAAIGIALFPGHAGDPAELMRRAKVAMYRAQHVVGQCALYSGWLDQERGRRLALIGDLRGAIDRNELLLYCQPKVQIAGRRLCGAEALVRWQHKEHGMVSPTEFVQLAEQAGLIAPLTGWVLEAAFSQRYTWHEEGIEQPLAVNLSVRDLRDPRLLDRIRGLFATWGTLPDWMQFEITESALMDDPDGGIDTLRKLKDLGAELVVDDFGTGYSSLSYLQRMPVDALKIDQSFVRRMNADKDSATIVRSTIELSHSLKLQAIAEGVESEALWLQLSELGCDICQGYYVGKPLLANGFQEWAKQSAWQ